MGSVVSIKFCKAKKLSEQGDALEQFVLGLMYMGYSGVEDVGENHQEGIKWLKRSAEQENIEAKVSLGFHLAIGKVVERDINKALPLLLEGARDGHWFAQLIAGSIYLGLFGGKTDYQEALKWLTESARQGNMMAQFLIGELYFNGEGVNKNYEKAAKWLKKAVEQGYARAGAYLGQLY